MSQTITEPIRSAPHFVLRPRRGWQLINFREIVAYADLFYFLIWRDIKVRYAQSVLGIGWAIIQPLFQTGVFTLIFGNFGGMHAPGGWPYPLFSFCATVPWAFFSTSLTESSSSLVSSAHMISKVYFPRLILPMTSVLGKLLDFVIAMALLGVLMGVYRHPPTIYIVFLPLLVLLMFMSASGLGMLLTAMAIQYRDVRYAMGFAINLVMWASPVAYSTYQMIPERYQMLYAINPMVGIIEGFRFALLGAPTSLGPTAMPWDMIGLSAGVSAVLLIIGALYFRRMERVFADVA